MFYKLLDNNRVEEVFKHLSKDGELVASRKDNIIKQGDPADYCILILSGIVDVLSEGKDDYLLVTTCSAGEILGEMGLFCSTQKRTTSVRAHNEVRYYKVMYQDFMQYVSQGHNDILCHLTVMIADRLKATTSHTYDIANLKVKDRIIKLLIEFIKQAEDENECTVKVSRRDIAARVGCTRELAGRYIGEIHDEGYIDAKGMNIKINRTLLEYR